MKTFRQGDILFIEETNENKEGLELCKDKIVAHGEITGHHHSFSSDSQVLLYKKSGMENPELMEIQQDNAVLSHQEHLPLVIPKGLYRIKREQEYNPFTKQLNKVKD